MRLCLSDLSHRQVKNTGVMASVGLLCVCAFISAASCVTTIGTQPEQVHISYPGVIKSMVVTWLTCNDTDSVVEFSVWGEKLFSHTVKGNSSVFTDGGPEKRKMFIHRVTLTDLKPAAAYVYHCGSEAGWSDIFYFTSLNESSTFSPRFALFGDMGNENAQSLSRLQKETQIGMYDVILHIGDFAYDMHEDNGKIGDEFMRQIQSIAAYTPYMTCPGNHEWAYNFSHYRNRFSMPGHTENLWYSWNVGPVHIISFSTEVYFYLEYGLDLLFRQYEWLQKDLEVQRNKMRKPTGLRTERYARGSSRWHTDPCTVPTMMMTTAHTFRAMCDLDAMTHSQRLLAWRIYSINTEWIWSCGLMNTHMRDSGLCMIIRCLMEVFRSRM
ncbi:acid phosphatase type 7 isoform X5 [Myxocyprinus asiaticus]|uniref:acid phosphatase type 7 isoform X5 n=1 Tax=Myxocyprinus asiaticus TaxID=70543 RepID=UPI0022223C7C|nr:acid phosphatase type 7 isoform X5 [Myxocyprinus asiaticus]XP_051578849.1 acid phosphatase type 7 isoform X5 [Myxocyprinus asiaticus]XP_051578850.1 acid phosphatase type 7 isoform X5 [Myxocyprinus asiaticus]